MPSILYRMYDLNPKNPTTITDGIAITCSDVNAVYPIGSAYTRHAFIVIQDADITVKNAEGNTLQRGTDFFISASAADQRYSKDYNTSIYSGIKFKSTGTFTVTSFISVGTYPRATWFNYALETLLAVINTSIPAMQAAVNNFSSSLSDMTETVMQIAQTVTSHGTRLTALESNPTIIVVADHATMDALTGLKTGTTVYVVSDTDGKRAEYLYDGSAFQKTSDPDWENINIDWSALLNIPSGVAALIAGTLASTALADMPTPADTDDTKVLSWDKTTGKYKLLTVSAAAGVGDVAGPSSAVSGHIPLFSGTTGKIIEDSGIAPSALYASACASQEVSTTDVTITDNKDGTMVLSGTFSGQRIVTLPAAVWRKTIICTCTGTDVFVSIKAAGQTSTWVRLYRGEVADVYCDGTTVKRVPGKLAQLYIGLYVPQNVLLFDGSTKSRASYPDLWEMIAAGRLPYVTDATWLSGAVGAFSTGDGSTTFRLPDWRGLFPRGAGTNSVLAMANLTKFTGGALAEIILDAMQGHSHDVILANSYGTGAPLTGPAWNAPSFAVTANRVQTVGPIWDGYHGGPRIAGETRPVSVSLNFGIYFE